MKEWLSAELKDILPNIKSVYLFGSSIDGRKTPNDVDVVVVTAGPAGSPGWLCVIEKCRSIEKRFAPTFGLPLFMMVVTPDEWEEIDNVVVRERLSLADF